MMFLLLTFTNLVEHIAKNPQFCSYYAPHFFTVIYTHNFSSLYMQILNFSVQSPCKVQLFRVDHAPSEADMLSEKISCQILPIREPVSKLVIMY